MFRRGRAFLTLDACETTRVQAKRVEASEVAKTRGDPDRYDNSQNSYWEKGLPVKSTSLTENVL